MTFSFPTGAMVYVCSPCAPALCQEAMQVQVCLHACKPCNLGRFIAQAHRNLLTCYHGCIGPTTSTGGVCHWELCSWRYQIVSTGYSICSVRLFLALAMLSTLSVVSHGWSPAGLEPRLLVSGVPLAAVSPCPALPFPFPHPCLRSPEIAFTHTSPEKILPSQQISSTGLRRVMQWPSP